MAANTYPFHHHSEVQVGTDPVTLFAHLGDHRRLSAHMERPSLMAAGAVMRIETDERQGKAVRSVISMRGRVLGMRLHLDEVVTRYDPPRSKTWETRGEPRLLVVGIYRMGFSVVASGRGSTLTVFIDYQRPQRSIGRLCGYVLGSTYAAWCTRRIAADAERAFPPVRGPARATGGERE